MRIAYVTAATIPSLAANGVQSAKMCDAFVQAGHRVILVSSDRDQTAPDADLSDFYGLETRFAHIQVPWPRSLPGPGYRYAFRAVGRVRRARPDLVYTRTLRVAVAAASLGLQTILELHALDSLRRRDDAAAFQLLLSLPALKHIVTISDALREDVESSFPRSVGRCIVAHDAATPPRPDLVPADLERRPGETLVGYVGSLYPGRGLELIMALAHRLPGFRFHIAGALEPRGGSGGHGEEPPPNINFHGFVPPTQTDAFRAACDILIAPYQAKVETFGGGGDTSRWMSPLKLFEYMASGRPIVCSDIPVLREVLADGKTALLCPPSDIDAWCTAINSLKVDTQLASRLAAEAESRYLAEYSYSQRARIVLQGLGSYASEEYRSLMVSSPANGGSIAEKRTVTRWMSGLRPVDRRFRLARIWSNEELRKIAPLFSGTVMNVSGWQDADKEGGHYRDYFSNATEYLVTNHLGARGADDGTTDIHLDLSGELPKDLVARCDVAFNHTTLEHIYEVRDAFRNLCLLTRDVLIVVVPFAQEQHFTEDYGDFWRFTPLVLNRLCEENGLSSLGSVWNSHKNAATYVLHVAVRRPDRHQSVRLKMRAASRHPGEWIGKQSGAALLEGRFRGGWMSCWGRCGAGAAAGCRRLVA